MAIIRTILFIFLVIYSASARVNRTDIENLYKELLNGYNKEVRPDVNQTEATSVTISMYLLTIGDLDELSGTLSVVAYLVFKWAEPRMVWQLPPYDNITQIFMPQIEMWTPQIGLGNPVTNVRDIKLDEIMVRIAMEGYAEMVVGDFFQTSCSFDATHFPFDKQICPISFTSLSYQESDLKLYDGAGRIETLYMSENGEWTLTGHTIEESRIGSYSELIFTLHLERRSEFFIISIFIPFILLVMLNSIVFLLPADSGERMGYSMTCLLAIAVFLTLVSDKIPGTSKPMSVLTYIIMLCLLLSTFIMILIIVSLSYHHTGDDKPVPKYLKNIVLFFNTDRCCRRKTSSTETPSKYEKTSTPCKEVVEYRSTYNKRNQQHNKYSYAEHVKAETRKKNWKIKTEAINVIVLNSLKNVNDVHKETKYDKTEDIIPEPDVKWKDYAKLFDKFCLAFVLGCTFLLGSIYFLITSGRL